MERDIWPASDSARLDILSRLPMTSSAALDVRAAIDKLEAQEEADRDLSARDLADLEALTETGRTRAETIRGTEIPEEVVAFWGAAWSEPGATLASLTPGVTRWLTAHGAEAAFTIRRSH